MADTTVDFGAGNTARYYVAPGVNLPVGPWVLGAWGRVPPTASFANAYGVLFGLGDLGADASLLFYIYPSGANQYDLSAFYRSAGANIDYMIGTFTVTGIVEDDFLFVVQRTAAGDLETYAVPKGGTVSAPTASASMAGTTALTDDLHLGVRADLDASTFWYHAFGETFFQSGNSLTYAEIEDIAAGAHAADIIGPLTFDLRLRTSNDPEPDVSGNGYDADQHGTGWTLADEFFEDGSTGITIDAGVESIALSTMRAAISSNRQIDTALESLLLTANRATISSNRNIAGAVESLSVSTVRATVSTNRSIQGAIEAVAVQGLRAGLSLGIAASAEQLTLGTLLARISSNRSISGQVESLLLSTNPAAISVGASIGAGVEQIALQANAAQVRLNVNLSTQLESILLTELAAQVTLGQAINAGVESLVVTPLGAVLTLSTGVQAHLETLKLSTFTAIITSPTVPIAVPGLEYTIAGERLHYTLPLGKLHFTFRG